MTRWPFPSSQPAANAWQPDLLQNSQTSETIMQANSVWCFSSNNPPNPTPRARPALSHKRRVAPQFNQITCHRHHTRQTNASYSYVTLLKKNKNKKRQPNPNGILLSVTETWWRQALTFDCAIWAVPPEVCAFEYHKMVDLYVSPLSISFVCVV